MNKFLFIDISKKLDTLMIDQNELKSFRINHNDLNVFKDNEINLKMNNSDFLINSI